MDEVSSIGDWHFDALIYQIIGWCSSGTIVLGFVPLENLCNSIILLLTVAKETSEKKTDSGSCPRYIFKKRAMAFSLPICKKMRNKYYLSSQLCLMFYGNTVDERVVKHFHLWKIGKSGPSRYSPGTAQPYYGESGAIYVALEKVGGARWTSRVTPTGPYIVSPEYTSFAAACRSAHLAQ